MCAMKKSEYKMQLRKEAKRVVSGARYAGTGHGAYRQDVEAGRKQLLLKSAEGGDRGAQRVKGELLYLMNNYLPIYDARIEQLIDQWRTSGDPAYEPGVKGRFRKVRADHMRKSNAV
jgi:hypothetical protein